MVSGHWMIPDLSVGKWIVETLHPLKTGCLVVRVPRFGVAEDSTDK